ncbi:hypothetical protein GCM10019817_15960 [Lactobacillus intestinalis]
MGRGIISTIRLNIKGILKPAPKAEMRRPKSSKGKSGATALIKLPIINPEHDTMNNSRAVKRSFKYDEQIIIIAIISK